jgi:hypothetical protein
MNRRWIDITRACIFLPVGAQADVFLLNAGRRVRESTQRASRDKNNPANSGSSPARILYPSPGAVAKYRSHRLVDYNYVAEASCAQVQAARARGMTETRSTETNWTKMERVS